MSIIKNFDQLTKKQFDQTPKLLENFNQLKMSSEIWSSDRFPSTVWIISIKVLAINGKWFKHMFFVKPFITIIFELN